MKVTYIHHSSFFVETESACLLFDYFKGEDHFSKVIFDLAKEHPDIRYLLSFDIWRKRVPEELKERTVFLKPGEIFEDGYVSAEAFRSTDEGVAFWCRADGFSLYHAGDLNHWYWEEEDEQWNRNMTKAYREEIGKMESLPWQYFVAIPDVKSTGIKDGKRYMGWAAVIRAINTVDAVTAESVEIPFDMLCRMRDRIIAEVPGINRVLWDISDKPVATIEWE